MEPTRSASPRSIPGTAASTRTRTFSSRPVSSRPTGRRNGRRRAARSIPWPPTRRSKFEPLDGKACRVYLAKGELAAMNMTYKFQKKLGAEPEEIYFRYYLRFGDDWKQTVQAARCRASAAPTARPAGAAARSTATTAGRPAARSASPSPRQPAGRQAAPRLLLLPRRHGRLPTATAGSGTDGYRGFLDNNRWYCVEQYVKLNTPGETAAKEPRRHPPRLDRRPARLREDRHPLPRRGSPEDRAGLDERLSRRHDALAADQHLYVDNVVVAGNTSARSAADERIRQARVDYAAENWAFGLGEGGDRDSGRRIVNVLPLPIAMSIVAGAGRWPNTMCLTIARPRPLRSRTLQAASPIDTVEPLEESVVMFRRDAAAAIDDGDAHVFVAPLDDEANLPARVAVLHRILQQIADRLLQQRGVRRGPDVPVAVDFYCHVAFGGPLLIVVHGGLGGEWMDLGRP